MGMEIRSFRSAELGNAAHVVIERASGVAVVVDPVRDIGQYLDVVAAEAVELAWALETHVHNDFVSGARELVASAGTRLGASGDAGLRYPYERLGDGDEIEVGSWRLRVLATPGHTPEHVAYVLVDPAGEPQALFSGGALMVGTAARTDLFGPALSWRFAHDLERSLKEKILELSDHVVVYPTHGGGSFCAAGAGSELTTTIGAERAANPLATARSSRQFVIRALTAGTYPSYYARMRSLNQAGAPLLGPVLPTPPPLDVDGLDTWLAQGALVVDVRPAGAFRAGHIEKSVAAGADGNVSGWVGWLVGPERPLVLVADADVSGDGGAGRVQVAEATRQLARIGYDRVVGFLEGGIEAWRAAGGGVVRYETISAAALAKRLDADELLPVIDVREAAEWHAGHIPGSVNIPVHDIGASNVELPRGMALAVHCGHDYRATLGASLLERAGHHRLVVVDDGWDAWAVLDHDHP
ncbi:MAG: rhodanese-like domain-containing protein [Actinomycetota bacterium]|nr:rhodanese-like domain-containing protein [Actinomycetota bacterium]MDA8074757.1 rhodanese-like domain-containing protein [Actinomycetota bacterium]